MLVKSPFLFFTEGTMVDCIKDVRGLRRQNWNSDLRWFRKLARDEHSHTFCGSEFQVVGVEMRKAHDPIERLWCGTVSS